MNQAHTPITTKPLCNRIAPKVSKAPTIASIVEKQLRDTKRNLTLDELVNLTGLPHNSVKSAVKNITDLSRLGRRGYNMNRQHVGGNRQAYRLLASDPPKPSPTLLPAEGTLTPAPTRNIFAGQYDGAELRPFVDRPGCNDHMQHGSRRGEVVTPYSGPRPMCVGTGLGIYGPGSSTSGRARGG